MWYKYVPNIAQKYVYQKTIPPCIFICKIWQPYPRGLWRGRQCGPHLGEQGTRGLGYLSSALVCCWPRTDLDSYTFPGPPAPWVLRPRDTRDLRASPTWTPSSSYWGKAAQGPLCTKVTTVITAQMWECWPAAPAVLMLSGKTKGGGSP